MESQLTKRDKKLYNLLEGEVSVGHTCWNPGTWYGLLSAMNGPKHITLTQTLSAQASEVLSITFPYQEQLAPKSP